MDINKTRDGLKKCAERESCKGCPDWAPARASCITALMKDINQYVRLLEQQLKEARK